MIGVVAFVALQALPVLRPMLEGWYAVSGDDTFVAFALRSSVTGPPEGRNVVARLVRRSTVGGIKGSRFVSRIDCNRSTMVTISNEAFAESGSSLGPIAIARKAMTPITGGTVGAALKTFACDPAQPSGLAAAGYPVMLTLDVVADQAFRFMGLGIDRDAALALAAVDADRAPKAWSDMLNVFVPAARQNYVRAIKTPDADAD